jgi:hypothetical protein
MGELMGQHFHPLGKDIYQARFIEKLLILADGVGTTAVSRVLAGNSSSRKFSPTAPAIAQLSSRSASATTASTYEFCDEICDRHPTGGNRKFLSATGIETAVILVPLRVLQSRDRPT